MIDTENFNGGRVGGTTPGQIPIANAGTYRQDGFQAAQNAQSRADAIPGFLNIVYDRFLESERLNEQGLKERIEQLRKEMLQEKARRLEIVSERQAEESAKSDKEQEIQELELERIDIRNGEGEMGNTIPFVIATFITLMLTLYLFVFYSSSGYSALYGVKPGSLGFINPNVFRDATQKGPGVIALVILFPVIFLGLGFLIHDALEKNKKLKEKNKPSQLGGIISLLFITLVADGFIGYKISEGVHNNSFNAGTSDELWKPTMIFSDVNFYLVLILGFVVYVIWGVLLHFVLSHPYLKTESEKVKLMLEHVGQRIQEKRKELAEIQNRIFRKEADIQGCDEKINEKQREINGYESGDIPVNIPALKGAIGEFSSGWQNYTNNNLANDPELAKRLVSEAIEAQTVWLNQKLASLSSTRTIKN